MKILESNVNSKFEAALSIAKKYGYRLHDVYNKPDNYVLRSPGLFGFTVSYGTKPAMIVPTITIGGTVGGEVDKVIQERDKLNTAIELAKELEKLYSSNTLGESNKPDNAESDDEDERFRKAWDSIGFHEGGGTYSAEEFLDKIKKAGELKW